MSTRETSSSQYVLQVESLVKDFGSFRAVNGISFVVPRGKIVGSTDKLGGDVRETPVSPKDVLATTFHLLGIDPHTHVTDSLGRPFPIAGSGAVRPELLG